MHNITTLAGANPFETLFEVKYLRKKIVLNRFSCLEYLSTFLAPNEMLHAIVGFKPTTFQLLIWQHQPKVLYKLGKLHL